MLVWCILWNKIVPQKCRWLKSSAISIWVLRFAQMNRFCWQTSEAFGNHGKSIWCIRANVKRPRVHYGDHDHRPIMVCFWWWPCRIVLVTKASQSVILRIGSNEPRKPRRDLGQLQYRLWVGMNWWTSINPRHFNLWPYRGFRKWGYPKNHPF